MNSNESCPAIWNWNINYEDYKYVCMLLNISISSIYIILSCAFDWYTTIILQAIYIR